MKVLLVADNCSRRMGGEAILPYHYFRLLLSRGHDVRLLVHERNRVELLELFPEQAQRIMFLEDTNFQKTLWRWGEKLPKRVAETTFWLVVGFSTSFRMVKAARKLVKELGIELVHQVTPVAPKAPSPLKNLGAPIIFGPMNGGMTFPKAFRGRISLPEQVAYAVGKSLAALVNFLISGKKSGDLLLAANPRTMDSLRRVVGPRAPIELMVENGVDLSLWTASPKSEPEFDRPTFVFIGRLVDWKGVDYLLSAFCELSKTRECRLVVIGSGDQDDFLKAEAARLGISDRVEFLGFLDQGQVPAVLQKSRALVLPSIFECGGAVVLEAMAMGKAVVATDWGGPADYLDSSCGILVRPDSQKEFVEGFAAAMAELADSPSRARELGLNGKKKVENHYDWEKKVDAMEIRYQTVRTGWLRTHQKG